ncbi:hypothetical protein [Pedobacter sp. GR22-6]|uniref:hypothetical protein n=1 Tax=Pedobacter sp. GR22-6 TaxID=3127957 RepID=UPI00307F8C7D
MTTMSFVFFGLMLIPLVIFLVWIIRKDKNKNYLGLVILVVMAIVALVTIVKFDAKFLQSQTGVPNNAAAPSYR